MPPINSDKFFKSFYSKIIAHSQSSIPCIAHLSPKTNHSTASSVIPQAAHFAVIFSWNTEQLVSVALALQYSAKLGVLKTLGVDQ